MKTLIEPTRNYRPCPWCKQPGKLIFTSYDRGCYGAYQVGCVNKDCPVRPRTPKIRFNGDYEGHRDKARECSIERWEGREC